MQWRRRLANPHYHLILHWNHYLCSSALSHWVATVSPLTVLGTSSRFLCSWSLIPSSHFLEMMTTLDVWMEVLVLVCSKLTPKLTLWSQTHVLIWRCWKLPLTVTLTSTIQTQSLETMFAYSVYHLILHWNHYLCSSALSRWLATVSRSSWPSWEPSRPF
jgi:hypothetical protein